MAYLKIVPRDLDLLSECQRFESNLCAVANVHTSVKNASSRVMNALFVAIKLPSNSSRAYAPSKGYFT